MYPAIAIGITLLLLGILYLSPQGYRLLQFSRWKCCSNLLALTYDDGPDGETTPQILALLNDLQVKATFYLVGFRAERHPDVVRQLHDAKHEIGSHMFYHKHTFKTAPWTEYHEVIACDQYLANLLGHPVHYRPPYGKITLVTMLRLMSAGRRIDWWSVATNDTGQLLTDPETLAKNIIAQKLPVVLMHSHHKDPKRREFVLQLTRQLVEKARQNNVRLVTMTELTICVDQLHKQK